MRLTRTPAGPLRALLPALIALSTLNAASAQAQSSYAGPWVQTKDGYYATSRLGWANTSRFYDLNGDEQTAIPDQTYKNRVVSLDSEYGISNHLTLHLAMPVEFPTLDVPGATPDHYTNGGFGDLVFGFKYGILDPDRREAVALEVAADTPTGYNAYGFGFPSLGRGKFSVDGHLYAGVTLDPTPVYLQAEGGYRKFTDNTVSDALTYGAEAGVFATPRVLVVANLEAEHGRDDTKLNFLSYTTAQGLVQYRVKPHLDVMAGYRTTLSGKQTLKLNEVRIGVALKGNALGRYRGQASAGATLGAFGQPKLPSEGVKPSTALPGAAAPGTVTLPPASEPGAAPADTTQAPGQPK